MDARQINLMLWGVLATFCLCACSGEATSSLENSGSGNNGNTSRICKYIWDWLNPSISYGEITDERDGQVYKTVRIGNQTWMAENLTYDNNCSGRKMGCECDYDYYNSCYYTWEVAMGCAGVFSGDSLRCEYSSKSNVNAPVRGICPKGWHIPSMYEWETLLALDNLPAAIQAKNVQAKNVESWTSATDAYGFSAVPFAIGTAFGMKLSLNPMKCAEDCFTEFLSATEVDESSAVSLFIYDSDIELGSLSKKNGFSPVRCLKD